MSIKHTILTANGTATVSLTPLSAIKRNCEMCMGFQKQEVKHCTSPLCPLYPFRLGKGHTGRKGNPDSLKQTL